MKKDEVRDQLRDKIKDIRILTGNGFTRKKRKLLFFTEKKDLYKFDIYEDLICVENQNVPPKPRQRQMVKTSRRPPHNEN